MTFSVFPRFFFFLSLSIPALIFLLVYWRGPDWALWRAFCVWSRAGRCQGGRIRSAVRWSWGMDGWMDGWAAGMHVDICLLLLLLCSKWICTNNCCVPQTLPQNCFTSLSENAFSLSPRFLFQPLSHSGCPFLFVYPVSRWWWQFFCCCASSPQACLYLSY